MWSVGMIFINTLFGETFTIIGKMNKEIINYIIKFLSYSFINIKFKIHKPIGMLCEICLSLICIYLILLKITSHKSRRSLVERIL